MKLKEYIDKRISNLIAESQPQITAKYGIIRREFPKNEVVEETDFTDEQKQKIEDFVKSYTGNFKDEDVHTFADNIGVDKHEIEEYIYDIARKHLNQ